MSDVTFNISNDAINFVCSLDAKQVKQVWKKITDLKRDPRPSNSEHLSGYSGYFRITIGEFRCIYEYDKEVVHIKVIERRNDGRVYQKMKRLCS